jgi:hypothetical protein
MYELNQEQMVSQKVQNILNNTNFLTTRFTAGLNVSNDTSPLNKQISSSLVALATIASNAPTAFHYAPTEDIDRLINSMHKHSELCSDLATLHEKKNSLKLNAAHTEAALKGFLHQSLSSEKSLNAFKLSNLTTEETLIVKEATKQALLALSNKAISKEEYADRIIDKTKEILKLDTRGFSDEKIEQFGLFVAQGKKIPKLSGVLEYEEKLITESISKSIQDFTKFFEDNAAKITPDNFPKLMATHESDKILNNAIAGFGIDATHTKKIIDKLSPALSTLGANYLQEHGVAIREELTKALAAGKSLSAKFGMNYTISTGKLDEISNNILNTHQDKNKEHPVYELVREQIEGPVYKKARDMLKDAKILIPRLETYLDQYIPNIPKNSHPIAEQIVRNEGALSVIGTLGIDLIRENVPPQEIDTLINAIHAHKEQCINLAPLQKDKDSLSASAAIVEAKLKGFIAPSSNSLNDQLTKEELSATIDATKQAMLELSDKGIPKEEYAQKIIDKTTEILKQDTRGFTEEQLEQFGKFIEQGKVMPKPTGLSDEENKLIAEATNRSAQDFIQFFQDNANIIASDDFLKLMATHESDKIINNAMADFSIDEKHTQKIINKLSPSLARLGNGYLREHGDAITEELTKALATNKSLSAKFGANYTISTGKLNMISDSIQKAHQGLANTMKTAKKLNKNDLALAKDLIEKSHMSSVQNIESPTILRRPRGNAIVIR